MTLVIINVGGNFNFKQAESRKKKDLIKDDSSDKNAKTEVRVTLGVAR